MTKPIRVLILEDRADDAELMLHELRRADFDVTWERVDTENGFLAQLETHPDIILSDYAMPGFDGMSALRLLPKHNLDIPFIMVSGTIGEEVAVTAIKAGAADYLLKDRLMRLGPAVERALEEKRSRDEKQRADEQLQRTQARLADILENAAEAIIAVDQKHGIVSFNYAAQKMFGYSTEEILGQSLDLLIPESLVEIHRHHVDGFAVAADQKIPMEHRGDLLARRQDGSVFPVEIGLSKLIESEEELYTAIVVDITERKEAERIIVQGEKRYRTTLDSMMEGCQIIDYDWRYIYVNDAAVKQWRKTPYDLLMHTMMDAYPEIENTELFHKIQLVMDDHVPQHIQDQFFFGDGTSSWFDLTIQSVSEGIFILSIDITERKRTEEALLESEAKFRKLVEHLPTVVYMNAVGDASSTTYVSPQIETLLGYTPEEWLADPKLWMKTLHPEDRQHVLAEAEAADQRHESFNMEYRMIARDGRLVWVHDQVTIVNELEGKSIFRQGIMLDITERKHAEEELVNSEKRFRALIENGVDYISLLTADGRLLWESPSNTRMLGYKENEFLGQNILEIIHPNDLSWIQKRLAKLISTPGGQDRAPFRLRHQDGSWRWVEAVVTNLLNEPSVGAIVINYHDITERKHAEDALQKSEERFRTLIEQSSDGVVLVDEQGAVAEWNQAQAAITGIPRSRAIGTPFGEIQFQMLLPEHRAGRNPEFYRKAVQDVFLTGQSPQFGKAIEIEIQNTAGERKSIIQSSFPIKTESGYRMGSIMRDVTERKQAEKKYHDLFENSPDGIFQSLPDGRYIIANPALARMWGYDSPDDLLASITDIAKQVYVNPDVRTEHMRLLKEQGGNLSGFEYQARRKDGSVTWVSENVRSILGEDGVLHYYEGTVEDISSRKQAEEALRNSEIKLRSLFAAMEDVIIVYNIDGRYIEIAPTDPTNLYRPLEEMLGRTVTELFPPDQASFFLDHIHRTLKTGQLTNAEYSLSFGNQVRWFSASVSPLSSNSVIWVARDITERKQAEERIQRQLEHLSALSEIDRMIASSFDLRLSLTSVIDRVISQQKVDAADILIMDPDLNILEFGAGHGFHTFGIEKEHLSLGEGYAGRAALERQTIHIPDLRIQTDNPTIRKAMASDNFVSYYAVPLIAKGKVKGVLEVFHRSLLDPDFEWLDFLNTLAGQAAIAIDNATLLGNLQRSNQELSMAYDATIEGWSRALDLRDKETEGHTQRVTEMTLKLARAFGLSDSELVQVRWGALLHDIGKMGVPDGILHKPGPLTDEEWVAMKKHPTFAYEMLSPIRYLQRSLDIPYCHHEKWDGTGYPRGLKGTQIPMVARIFAVIDVWDALRSDRPYRAAWEKERVLEHIRGLSGTHFDPQAVDLFMQNHN